MEERNETKTLSFAEYDQLCCEACEGFVPTGSREAGEESLLLAVCREVYRYLGQDLMFTPMVNVSTLEKYKWNLQRLVHGRQSEWFDTLQTPGKYINEALDRAYGSTQTKSI